MKSKTLEPVIYEVSIAYLKGGCIFEEEDTIKMDYCPRVGDVINTDGGYQEVMSVLYKSNQSVWPTIYVNIIGDSNDYDKWVIKKLKDSNPIKRAFDTSIPFI